MASIDISSPTPNDILKPDSAGVVTVEVTGTAIGEIETIVSTTTEHIQRVQIQLDSGSLIDANRTTLPPQGKGHRVSWRVTAQISTRSNFIVKAIATVTITKVTQTPSGPRTVTSTKTIENSRTVQVQGDTTGPTLSISLEGDATYACPPPGASLRVLVSGSAADDRTGVARVAVGLDPNNLSNARTTNGWASWDAEVLLPARLGEHTIFVQAWDNVGNRSRDQPHTLKARLDDRTWPLVEIDKLPPLFYDDGELPFVVSGTVEDFHSDVAWVQVDLLSNGSVQKGVRAALQPRRGSDRPQQWTANLTVTASNSAYIIRARAADTRGNELSEREAKTANLNVSDVPQPTITITWPRLPKDREVSGTDKGADITIHGDTKSNHLLYQVVLVEVYVDSEPPTKATPRALGKPGELDDWSKWSAEVHIPPQGTHTITARAMTRAHDEAKKYGRDSVNVTVGIGYKPQDPQDNLSLQAYFLDLLAFVRRRVSITSGAESRGLSATDLTRAFFQPFDRLSVNEQVRQARIGVEVLRQYLGPLTSGLVAHWRFDEGIATIANDTTAQTQPARIEGPSWAAGRWGHALAFDGVDDVVHVPPNQYLMTITNSFTIAFWAYPLAEHIIDQQSSSGIAHTSGQRYVIGPQHGDTAYKSADHAGVGISVATNGVIVCEHGHNFLPAVLVYDAGSRRLNTWTHVAVVYQEHQPRLYLNGQLIKVGERGLRPLVHAFTDRIGGMAFGFFQGLLDDVRLYNRSLSDADVASLTIMGMPSEASPTMSEADYRLAAYQALLVQFGISYEELRRARNAVPTEREALASRLGIDLAVGEAGRPDRLDQILLMPDQITEARLEQLFGLVDTSHDPLAQVATPTLFTWRMEHLRTLWRAEDHAEHAPVVPLIDPDIVGRSEIKRTTSDNMGEARNDGAEQPSENLAYTLWNERRTWIDGQLNALAADRQPGESDLARFYRLVEMALAPSTIAQLTELALLERAGTEITQQLAEHNLSLPAFNYLVHCNDLAALMPLLESEWADIYSIFVQVQKRRRLKAWRAQEIYLCLGPDSFRIVEDARSLPPWRANGQSRRKWQETLRGRISQEQTARQTFLDAVGTAEAAALPLLRDGLIDTVGAAVGIDVPNWLTQRLLIDVRGAGHLQTTRITQAIETIQSALISLRTDRFMEMDEQVGPLPAGSWTLTVPDRGSIPLGEVFDQEWTWMGSYASWRSAMQVFLYPENLLIPRLRTGTEAFQTWLTQQLTAVTAADPAANYKELLTETIQKQLTGLVKDWETKTYALNPQLSEAQLTERAAAIKALMSAKLDSTLSIYITEIFYFVPMQIALQLHRSGQYTSALDWFRTVYAYNLPAGARRVYYGLVQEMDHTNVYQTTDQWLRTSLNPHDIAPMRAGALTRFTIISIVRCFLDYADSEFAGDSGEAIARARTLYLAALDLLGSADMRLPGSANDPAEDFGFNPNPEPINLRRLAELNLFKIRDGRNIAGMRRQSLSYASLNRDLVVLSTFALQPTPYRYAVLIERAKQLVALAQQIEAAYLASLEKQDAETFSLFKANQQLGLTQASVQLQMLRVSEAEGGITLAALQRGRAEIQSNTYKGWIDGGKIKAETDMLDSYRAANEARNWVAGLNAAVTIAGALTESASGGILGTGVSFGHFGAGAVAVSAVLLAGAQVAGNDAEYQAQKASFQASYERRKQEWQLQRAVAEKDVAIGQQQVIQSRDHLRVVEQERTITQIQANYALAEVNFLAHKFTNAELYEWMSGILGRVYSYFLQQAAAVARLAQSQLAFERQERPLSLIRADYWQASSDGVQSAGKSGNDTDRRGLTGSARLLQDIYQLDQYAFETNKRKLQLSKTISLAQLAPFEFEQFRQTGVLLFATSMALFDRDFPGHYLRLIKRVRTSVVALIPPNHGIKASLTASGVSRVVIADGSFQEAVVHRDPELVALTSPSGASGVFELEAQSDMLLPFETMGVDTSWEFQLPRAANAFDFRTIADVLMTIEYTALHSYEYRQQVIQRLDPAISADRAFGLRDQFPDAWYDLHNPTSNGAPPILRFTTSRADFPPNIVDASLTVEQVLLAFLRSEGEKGETEVTELRFTPIGDAATALGGATTIDGIISTRRGNAASWTTIVGRGTAGMWEFKLSGTARRLFAEDKIDDVLLVITYRGQLPPWPV